MKLICAVVKSFKVPELVDAFAREAHFPGMTVLDSEGFGREKTARALTGAAGDDRDFVPHKLVLIAAPEALVSEILERLTAVAHTGQPGDGKVFLLPLVDAIALTSLERGSGALE